MASPTWQTTLEMPTSPMSAISAGGPTIHPTRQPIIRSSFEAEPTVIVLSAMPGRPAGCSTSRPSNRMRSMAAS
jgi:hypothetical protein